MRDAMAELRKKYPFTRSDCDRHGNERWYALDPKGRKIRLNPPGLNIEIGSDAFNQRYKDARAGKLSPEYVPSRTYKHGSIGHLVNQFLTDPRSHYNTELGERTRKVRRGQVLNIQKEHGHRDANGLTVEALELGRDKRKATPEGANNRLKAYRALYKYGMKAKLVTHNPAAEVAYLSGSKDGWHTWTLDEVKKYWKRHPVGTKARLAIDLFFWTGQRLGDVIRWGPQHVKDGHLEFTQQKTGVEMSLLVLSTLQASIDAAPSGHLTYMVTQFGKPFSDKGFGNWFKKRCVEADLPHCSAHGLRKALATCGAEFKLTPNQIKAITGHTTLKEVARYTQKADQKRIAAEALRTIEAQIVPPKSAHLKQVGGNEEKPQ